MSPIFSSKTILLALIGTGIVGSLAALPVQKSKYNLAGLTTDTTSVLAQIDYGDRFSNNEPTDNAKNIIGLTGLAIGTGVIGYYLSRAYKPSLATSSTLNHGGSALLSSVSPKLRRELLRLVQNQQTANRLLSGTLNSHPGRSANWVAEKVIYDLKRGR